GRRAGVRGRLLEVLQHGPRQLAHPPRNVAPARLRVGVGLTRREEETMTMKRLRWFVCALAALPATAPGLLAQQAASKGTLKKVDPGKGLVTITSDGRDQEFTVAADARVVDASGNPTPGGLRHEGFKPGAAVSFRVGQRDGKTVLAGLKLGEVL